jgi:peptide subunit release factor 1 (eRF1)
VPNPDPDAAPMFLLYYETSVVFFCDNTRAEAVYCRCANEIRAENNRRPRAAKIESPLALIEAAESLAKRAGVTVVLISDDSERLAQLQKATALMVVSPTEAVRHILSHLV